MQKLLIIFGILIILVGLLWPFISRLPLGKLPFDISLKLGNTQVYLPIGTCIIVSILITIVLKFFK